MTLKRRAAAGIAIAASSALALSACGGDGGDGEDGGSEDAVVTWAIASSWGDSWNLWTTEGNNSYLRQAITPMMAKGGEFNPDGEWEYNDAVFGAEPELLSEEPFQVAYTLNADANWGDGNPITVDDFIFAWHAASGLEEHCDEQCAPASTTGWEQIESIEETDGQIVVTYQEGYLDPEWSINYEPLRLPAHIAEENGFEDWASDPAVMGEAVVWFSQNPPTWSAGPYIATDFEAGEYITYEPNPEYAGSAEPALTELTLEVVEGTDTLVTELRNGSIDGAWPTAYDGEALAQLDQEQDLFYEVFAGSIWDHFDFNTNNEFLSDVELRRAIFTAIDVPDMIERVYPEAGLQQKTNHIFSENSPYYVDAISETGQGSGDVDAARTILEDAGYAWDGDALTTPDGEAVSIDLRMGAGNQPREQMAELAQSYLSEIGVEVVLDPIPDGDLADVLFGAEYDMILFGWSGNPAFTVGPCQFWCSDSDSNFGGLEVEGLDDVLEGVRGTSSLDEAAEAANEAVEIVTENAYVLPISDQPQSNIFNDRVGGLEMNGNSQSGPLWNVEDWTVE
ncbi:ABC transporter family substrate-binding protein [Glycomyces xiaoerkulensis]|uniref:ABC transporter family substrate-binding protein n=1 Tax=Glycomyces xiaoerkulensis TaxID=2038139 RepID=UPI000C266D2C|nr:ABC transporter family substrate-binding protein [Glycomyces xiaoerkulensis]